MYAEEGVTRNGEHPVVFLLKYPSSLEKGAKEEANQGGSESTKKEERHDPKSGLRVTVMSKSEVESPETAGFPLSFFCRKFHHIGSGGQVTQGQSDLVGVAISSLYFKRGKFVAISA